MTATSKILKEAGLLETEWGVRILNAEKRGTFTDDEQREALCWRTGPATKLNGGILCDKFGVPQDEALISLAFTFATYSAERDFKGTAKILTQMYRRANEIPIGGIL